MSTFKFPIDPEICASRSFYNNIVIVNSLAILYRNNLHNFFGLNYNPTSQRVVDIFVPLTKNWERKTLYLFINLVQHKCTTARGLV